MHAMTLFVHIIVKREMCASHTTRLMLSSVVLHLYPTLRSVSDPRKGAIWACSCNESHSLGEVSRQTFKAKLD